MPELFVGEPRFPERPLRVQRLLRSLQGLHLRPGFALRALHRLLDGALHDGEVGEEQLAPDVVELLHRPPIGAEAADDHRQRVRLAELRESLRARHAARDVDEANLCRHRLLRTLHLGEDREAGIGNRHDRDVGLSAVRPGPGESGEQGGLPREGHADQPDVAHKSANVSAGSR